MSAATTDPVFTEVLQLTLNDDKFSAGLKSVKAEYLKFLDELKASGGSGADASMMGGIGAIGEQIRALTAEIRTFTKGAADSLGSITTALADQVTEATAKISGITAEASEGVANYTGKVVETSEQRINRIYESMMTGMQNQARMSEATANEQIEIWNKVRAAIAGAAPGENVLEKFVPQNRTSIENISNAVTKQTADAMAAQEKIADSADAALEKQIAAEFDYTEKRLIAEQKATDEIIALREKEADASDLALQKQISGEFDAIEKRLLAEQKAADEIAVLREKEAEAADVALQKEIAAEFDAIEKRLLAEQKAADEIAALAQKEAEEQEVALQKQIASEFDAIEKRLTAERNAAAQQKAAQEKLADDVSIITLRADQAAKKSAEARTLAANGSTQAIRDAAQKAADAYTTLYDAIAAKAKATADEQGRVAIAAADIEVQQAERAATAATAAMNKAVSSAENPGRGSAAEGILGSLARVARFQVEWALVGAAIEAATAPLKIFTDFIKDGATYMEDLEQRTADLQGVIATTSRFAGTQKEQFAAAGVASSEMVERIQDASIKYGISVDILTRGFKSFMEAGGSTLTHNLDESRQVAELLAVTLKAAGKDATATRSLLSEIPKLLEGQAKPTSTLLQTLGLSVDQWNKMVADAKEHHDLLQQLLPFLEKYRDVAAQSDDRFGSMVATLKLIYDRVAALVAQQYWPVLKEDLKLIRDYFEQNADRIKVAADELGRFIAEALKSETIKTMLDLAASGIERMAIATAHLKQEWTELGGFIEMMKALNDLSNPEKGTLDDRLHRLHVATDAFNNASETARSEINVIQHPELANITELAGNLNRPLKDVDPSLLNGTGTKPPPVIPPKEKGGQQELLSEYKDQLDALLQAQKAYKQQQDELVTSHAQTQAQASANIIANNNLVTAGIRDLTQEMQKQIPAIKGINDAQKKALAAKLDDKQNSAISTLQTDDAAQRKKELDVELALEKGSLDQQLAAVKAFYAHKKEMAQLDGATKAQIVQLDVEAEQRAYTIERSLAWQRLADAGMNEKAQQTAYAQLDALEAQHTAFVETSSRKMTLAQIEDMKTVLEAHVSANKKRVEDAQSRLTADKNSHAPKGQLAKDAQALSQATIAGAKDNLAYAQSMLAVAAAGGANQKTLEELTAKVNEYAAAVTKAQAKNPGSGANDAATTAIFGDNRTSADKNNNVPVIQKAFDGFSDTVKSLSHAFTTFGQAANQIIAAYKQGGALGAAGAAGSTVGGLLQNFAGKAGIAGQVISAVSGVVSMISGFFTAYAQKVADEIKKSFNDTVQALNNGQATLSATLAAVQQERQDAINRLSGVKGGQDQLNKLLPEFDQEIVQLQNQIKQIKTSFEQSLAELELNNDAAAQFVKNWADVNKQVKDYLDAGGDVVKAQQFLSDSLKQQLQTATEGWNSGYETAIQDAINLNQLLTQRIDLMKQEKATEFGILSADAIERRQSGAITAATQLQAARDSFNQQLKDLNNQIDLTTQKVQLESTIYDINHSIVDLHKIDNAMQIQALQTQIAQAQAYKDIMSSITVGPNGQASLTGSFGVSIGQINITTDPNAVGDATTIGQTIAAEIAAAARSGGYGYSKAIAPGQ